MDTKNRIETRKAMRAEYERLQAQLRKNRRIILIGCCLVCLFIGFMARYITAYPKQRVIVSVEVPPQPETKAHTTSL